MLLVRETHDTISAVIPGGKVGRLIICRLNQLLYSCFCTSWIPRSPPKGPKGIFVHVLGICWRGWYRSDQPMVVFNKGDLKQGIPPPVKKGPKLQYKYCHAPLYASVPTALYRTYCAALTVPCCSLQYCTLHRTWTPSWHGGSPTRRSTTHANIVASELQHALHPASPPSSAAPVPYSLDRCTMIAACYYFRLSEHTCSRRRNPPCPCASPFICQAADS